MNIGTTFGYVAKAIEAVIWVTAMLGTAALSVFSHAFPPPIMFAIQTFFGVLLAFRVWLVKNTPMLTQLMDGAVGPAVSVPVTASGPTSVASVAPLDVSAIAAQVADILKGTKPGP